MDTAFTAVFMPVFGRLQSAGTPDFPDRLYPVWTWAAGGAVLYASVSCLMAYVFYSVFHPLGFLFVSIIVFAWLALYFMLLPAMLLGGGEAIKPL